VATLGGLISLILLDRAQLADVRQDVNLITRQIRTVSTEQAGLNERAAKGRKNTEVLERKRPSQRNCCTARESVGRRSSPM